MGLGQNVLSVGKTLHLLENFLQISQREKELPSPDDKPAFLGRDASQRHYVRLVCPDGAGWVSMKS